MRNYCKLFVAVGMLLGSVAPAFANSGSAIITTMRVSHTTTRDITSNFVVSNVSSRDVQVTINLFDQNGNPIGAGSFTPIVSIVGPFTSCNGTNTSCTLQAGKTAWFIVTPGTSVVDWYGYGSLEWSTSSSDSQSVSLVAMGQITNINSTGTFLMTPVPIANGLQF